MGHHLRGGVPFQRVSSCEFSCLLQGFGHDSREQLAEAAGGNIAELTSDIGTCEVLLARSERLNLEEELFGGFHAAQGQSVSVAGGVTHGLMCKLVSWAFHKHVSLLRPLTRFSGRLS